MVDVPWEIGVSHLSKILTVSNGWTLWEGGICPDIDELGVVLRLLIVFRYCLPVVKSAIQGNIEPLGDMGEILLLEPVNTLPSLSTRLGSLKRWLGDRWQLAPSCSSRCSLESFANDRSPTRWLGAACLVLETPCGLREALTFSD